MTNYLERAGIAREIKAQISSAPSRASGPDRDDRAADDASEAPRPVDGNHPAAWRIG